MKQDVFEKLWPTAKSLLAHLGVPAEHLAKMQASYIPEYAEDFKAWYRLSAFIHSPWAEPFPVFLWAEKAGPTGGDLVLAIQHGWRKKGRGKNVPHILCLSVYQESMPESYNPPRHPIAVEMVHESAVRCHLPVTTLEVWKQNALQGLGGCYPLEAGRIAEHLLRWERPA